MYVAISGKLENRRSVLLRHFVLNGNVSAYNPLLHIHATVGCHTGKLICNLDTKKNKRTKSGYDRIEQ